MPLHLECRGYHASTTEANGEQKQQKKTVIRHLSACFDAPIENDLTTWISKLAVAKKGSNALNYGDFRSVVLTNRQCIFERKTDSERVLVAINADSEPYTARF